VWGLQEVAVKVERLVNLASSHLLVLAGAADDSMASQLSSLTELDCAWQSYLGLQLSTEDGEYSYVQYDRAIATPCMT
jgi:hypothetical protein